MVALTRRERQRQATMAEIVEVSRALIAEGAELSLKGVAARMGMTAPALYRYVDSLADLEHLVHDRTIMDVVAAMAVERDRFPVSDPTARVAVSAAAFRRWAIRHPEEYRLVFTPDPTTHHSHPLDELPPAGCASCGHSDAQTGFGRFFGELFAELAATGHLALPAEEDLPEGVLEAFALADVTKAEKLDEMLIGPSPALMWTFEWAWARLYGVVTLEVFGKVHRGLVVSGVLFVQTLRDIGADVMPGADWDRMAALVREVLADAE